MVEHSSLRDAAQAYAKQVQALQMLADAVQHQVSELPQAPLALQENVAAIADALAQMGQNVTPFQPWVEIAEQSQQQIQSEIAERHRAERALEKIVEFNQQLLSSLNVGIAVCDRTLHYRLWNRFMENLSGYASTDVIGRSVFDVFPAFRTAGRTALLNRALAGELVTADDLLLEQPTTGKPRWFSMQFCPFQNENGINIGLIAITYDVTDRHQSEAALRLSEEKFHKAFRGSPVMLAIATLADGVLLDVNDSFLERYRCRREDVIGRTSQELGLWDTAADRDRLIEQLQREGAVRNLELTCRTHSGETLDVLLSAEFIQIDHQPCLLVASTDISPLKQTAAALEQSQHFIEHITTTTPNLLYIYDHDTQCNVYTNRCIGRVLGYPPHEQDLQGNDLMFKLLHPDDVEDYTRYLERCAALDDGELIEAIYRVRAANGEWRWFRSRDTVFLRSPEGHVKQTLGTGEDITEWKQAESQLRMSLTDKDALLREVHHRVKNNLQIISSLLDLQSNRVADFELRKILLDCQNRISSMALVHENLYGSDTFARVNFTQYIYQLSTNLFNTLRHPDDEIEMHLAIAPNISVNLIQAVPCGLLLNELITNAIKHGLPATGTGRLSIECEVNPTEQISLRVSTNGDNLKADFAPEQSSSLGMRLIVTLVKQLKGSLEVTRANPTTFWVRFPSIIDGA